MSEVLILGSEGTIGRRLVKELVDRGHTVTGADLSHIQTSKAHRGCRVDIADYRQIQRLPWETYDYVYHLAAEFGRLNGDQWYEQLWRTNAIGTRNVIECMKGHKGRLIFASSSEIYGENDAEVLRESTRPGRLMNDYAISKWVNEQQIHNATDRHVLHDPVVCRFFNSYGPGEIYHPFRSVVCLFVHQALVGGPYTVYEGYRRAFMYMDDFIPTLANVMDAEKLLHGISTFNIGGLSVHSIEDLDRAIRHAMELLGRSFTSDVTYMPAEQHNMRDKEPDNTRAVLHLGHRQETGLRVGVFNTMEWMAKEMGL